MNKRIVLANITALLATNIAFAGHSNTVKNPTAKPNPTAHKKLSYGCIGTGGGKFEGKVDCEGQVVGGCLGTGTGTPQQMPPEQNCAGTNGQQQGTQNGQGPCNGNSSGNNCAGN